MLWYEKTGESTDVVISSRVRLARNIEGYPFEPRLDANSSKELIEKLKGVYTEKEGYKFTDFTSLSRQEKEVYAEKYLVSPEFAQKRTPHALFSNEDKSAYIMVCEEDHLRIQSVQPGFNIKTAYENAIEAEEIADAALPIAYSERLGYLTHCPTNLGTGMRASVMMFLPGLSKIGQIRPIAARLGQLGLTVRGMNGEGSTSDGMLYQISNQVTLGVSEEEIIEKLNNVIGQIIESERSVREKLKNEDGEGLFDISRRALGIALYAGRMSYGELLELYSKLRLGVSLGSVTECDYLTLDKLRIEANRANLICRSGLPENDSQGRDRIRAELVRNSIMKK